MTEPDVAKVYCYWSLLRWRLGSGSGLSSYLMSRLTKRAIVGRIGTKRPECLEVERRGELRGCLCAVRDLWEGQSWPNQVDDTTEGVTAVDVSTGSTSSTSKENLDHKMHPQGEVDFTTSANSPTSQRLLMGLLMVSASRGVEPQGDDGIERFARQKEVAYRLLVSCWPWSSPKTDCFACRLA